MIDVHEGAAECPAKDVEVAATITELIGTYAPRRPGWRRYAVAAALMVACVVVIALYLDPRRAQLIAQTCFFTVLLVTLYVMGSRRQPHTTITREGLAVLFSPWSRPRRVPWSEVREVRPPAPLAVRGDVLRATGEKMPLVAMTQRDLEQLATVLGDLQRPDTTPSPR